MISEIVFKIDKMDKNQLNQLGLNALNYFNKNFDRKIVLDNMEAILINKKES